MRDPWGVSQIYSIRDPQYRGVRFIPQDRLVPLVETAVEANLQFTAHAVGDGAVQALLDAYEDVNRRHPVRDTRPSITHSNFMSREAIDQAARLGVVVDIQPAWLYLDGKTLLAHFGYERLRWFQPLRSIFAAGGIAGGGSDHMQKIGPRRSINFYDPFLAMQTTVARIPRGLGEPLHPEEALDRRQMIRFYTANNALSAAARATDRLAPDRQAGRLHSRRYGPFALSGRGDRGHKSSRDVLGRKTVALTGRRHQPPNWHLPRGAFMNTAQAVRNEIACALTSLLLAGICSAGVAAEPAPTSDAISASAADVAVVKQMLAATAAWDAHGQSAFNAQLTGQLAELAAKIESAPLRKAWQDIQPELEQATLRRAA